jgi:hypothetical protein
VFEEIDDLVEFDPRDVPPHIRSLCEACVEYVERSTGVVLDYTPETLPLLDHYLDEVREAKTDVQTLVASAAGAYFGELVRRIFNARWHAPALELDAWRIEFTHCFLHFNPVGMAREAIESATLGEGFGFQVNAEDLEALQAGLSVFGEIPEDEYYRLATRMEAVGPIVDRLLASALARDEGDVEYGPEIYRHALEESGAAS